MKTLQELWIENDKKPFKAEKQEKTEIYGVQNVPVGTQIQVIEELDGELAGMIISEKENRTKMNRSQPVWKKID